MFATLAFYNLVSALVTHLNTIHVYANRYVMKNQEGSS